MYRHHILDSFHKQTCLSKHKSFLRIYNKHEGREIIFLRTMKNLYKVFCIKYQVTCTMFQFT